jgi:nickel transport protein
MTNYLFIILLAYTSDTHLLKPPAMRRVPTLFLVAALAGTAHGHDLWVERQGNLQTLQYGHERSGHAGAKQLEYKPEQVKNVACFDADGVAIPAAAGRAYPVTLKGPCAASWFLSSSGYWSKTPYGTKHLPRTEAGTVMDSWLSVESVKRLDAWAPALARPLTRELEIVPLDNPLALKPGGKLRLKVTLDGKPVGGATVAYFGHPRGVSGADGQVNVRLRQPGFQLVQASLETPLDDGKADRLVQSTALQFEIAP